MTLHALHVHLHDLVSKHDGIVSDRGQSCEPQDRNHYCVDENTERRNHYLDLAGIENYTSRFDSKRCIFYSNITEVIVVHRENSKHVFKISKDENICTQNIFPLNVIIVMHLHFSRDSSNRLLPSL